MIGWPGLRARKGQRWFRGTPVSYGAGAPSTIAARPSASAAASHDGGSDPWPARWDDALPLSLRRLEPDRLARAQAAAVAESRRRANLRFLAMAKAASSESGLMTNGILSASRYTGRLRRHP